MTGKTHKTIALKAMGHFAMEKKEKSQFLRGNVMADFIPFYNYKQHYPGKSMKYVLNMNKKVDNYFKLGILTHFVSDFLCTPHFNNWRLYSHHAIKHIKFEKSLEEAVSQFDFTSVHLKKPGSRSINEKVIELYETVGKDYEENIISAYQAVCFMLDSYLVRQKKLS